MKISPLTALQLTMDQSRSRNWPQLRIDSITIADFECRGEAWAVGNTTEAWLADRERLRQTTCLGLSWNGHCGGTPRVGYEGPMTKELMEHCSIRDYVIAYRVTPKTHRWGVVRSWGESEDGFRRAGSRTKWHSERFYTFECKLVHPDKVGGWTIISGTPPKIGDETVHESGVWFDLDAEAVIRHKEFSYQVPDKHKVFARCFIIDKAKVALWLNKKGFSVRMNPYNDEYTEERGFDLWCPAIGCIVGEWYSLDVSTVADDLVKAFDLPDTIENRHVFERDNQ